MAKWWRRKIKGIAVLGAMGGALGAFFGGAWFTISSLFAGVATLGSIGSAAAVYGIFGAFTAGCLGIALATTRSRRVLQELSVPWAALVGGVAGAVFPLVFNVAMTASLLPLTLVGRFLPIMTGLGLFGAALTSGMVASAKMVDRRELGSAGSHGLLNEPSQD